MEELVFYCLNCAKLLKASYAEIRIVLTEEEALLVKNGQVERIESSTNQGFGVRVIVNGAWGFASSFRLEKKAILATTEQAVQLAKAASLLKTEDVKLAPVEVVKAEYKNEVGKNPFKIPLGEKIDLLLAADRALRQTGSAVKISTAHLDFRKMKKIFASSEGSFIKQEIITSGGEISATAISNQEIQRRSYPNLGGNYATAGFEFIEEMALLENAPRVAEEAIALLKAPLCPSKETTLVLGSGQLALQIHESCGHPTELDRVLGTEASFAGKSFLTRDKLNRFQYGSPLVNITADATLKRGLGSFGYDDEGVPAQKIDLIKEGQLVGYLSSRETARIIDRKSSGAMRAESWNRLPLVRMTNINLLPGEKSWEELIGEIKEGIFMDTIKSWSIDDLRVNFQFGTELAREIKNGKLGRLFKNPTYTGQTSSFWYSCDGICHQDEWKIWGLPNCGKGEPVQTMGVGHGTAPARFRNVQVGVLK